MVELKFPALIRSKPWIPPQPQQAHPTHHLWISNLEGSGRFCGWLMISALCRNELHLCRAVRAPVITGGIRRVEILISLSLSMSAALQQAGAPSRHVQIISVRSQMHSNQFILYFMIILWLPSRPDGFIIHDRQPSSPRPFPSLCPSILMLASFWCTERRRTRCYSHGRSSLAN